MDAIAMYIGYIVMVCAAVAALGGMLIGVAMIVNQVPKMLLASYGGWKTFYEFRDWYHSSKEQK